MGRKWEKGATVGYYKGPAVLKSCVQNSKENKIPSKEQAI